MNSDGTIKPLWDDNTPALPEPLTPSERAYLLALLDKCVNRNQLFEQYGVDMQWMRQSPYMPKPLFTWGHGWHMYDAHEVLTNYELSVQRRKVRAWTSKEINTALTMSADGFSIKRIGMALDRTPGAIQWKLKHTRRQLREAA